jgi:SprB repeat/Alpha amylase, catalytic domain/Secretion system C-terminal sorting domain/Domain of unknown function (DUF1939)
MKKNVFFLSLFLFLSLKSFSQDFMMQAWYWNYPKVPSGANWINTLNGQASGLNGKFTYMWLPPLAKPASGNNSNGYDPRDLYDYGQYNAGCPWGYRTGLNNLINNYNSFNIKAVADVVYNHRDGGRMENNPAVENWMKNFNGNGSPYPNDRVRCALPLGTGTLNGAGDYYFKFSSASGNTGSYGNKPYRMVMYTNKTPIGNLAPEVEAEPNGGGDCSQPFSTLTLGRPMNCVTDASGCLTDEFKISIAANQFNAADTLYISFTNTGGDFSDHRPYGCWNASRSADVINEVRYQTATNYNSMPSGQGGMNYLNFKPNGVNPTSLQGDWDWMWFFYDLEQSNPNTMTVLKDWTRWNWSNVGIKGFRMDAIKHFPPGSVSEILNDLHTNSMNPGMIVGESFDYNPYALKGWVDQVTGGMTSGAQSAMKVRVFDFALRLALKNACDGFGYDVRNVYSSGVVGAAGGNGFNTVTFVNNHDFRGPGEPVQNDPKLAYAYILTNNTVGVPCVYYPDYYGVSYANAPTVNLQSEINQLIDIHKQHIFGSNQLEYLNQNGSFYLNGSNYISASSGAGPAQTMIYQIKNGVSGRDVIVCINFSGSTLKVDHLINGSGNPQNTVFNDLMGNSAFPQAQVDAQGRIYIELPPRSYSVWLRQSGQPPAPVSLTATNVTNVTCAGGNNGSATVSATGGASGCNYSYLWSNGQSGPTATNLTAGVYSVLAYCGNQNGGYQVTITAPPAITINTPTTVPVSCAGAGSATVSATGGTGAINYAWSNNQIGATVPITTAGVYTVTATDANGCKKTTTANVSGNTTAPTAQITGGGNITCVNASVNLTTPANASFQYKWAGPNGNLPNTTNTITATAGGNYTVTVTNTANSCTKTSSVTVTANTTPPTAQINVSGQINCSNNTATLTNAITGSGYQYAWQSPTGATSASASYTVTTGGTYNLTVTNSQNGCKSVAIPTSVSESKTPPTISVSSPNNVIGCSNPIVTINASATGTGNNFSYTWSGPGITAGSGTPSVAVNAAGTYTVAVKDLNNNCTATKTFAVSNSNTTTVVTATSSAPSVSCANPTVTLNASAINAVSYSWAGPSGFTANTQNPSVGNAGLYTVTATEANGCKGIATVTVQDNKVAPTFNVTGNSGICNNQSTTLGTSNSYTNYIWSNGATTPTISITTAGTYTVSVTGSNGCIGTASKTLSNALQPVVNIPTDTLDCTKKSTVLNITTPSQLATTTWTGPGSFTSNVLSPTFYTPGIYTLVATTTQGCSQSFNATLYQGKDAVAVTIGGITALCAGATSTIIEATPNLGTYLWSTGETTNAINVDTPGSYTVTATNAQGCQGLAAVNVSVGQNPIVTASDVNACQGQTAQLSANVTNVTSNITYTWTDDNNLNAVTQNLAIQNVAPTNVGFYYVTAKNEEGCIGTDTILLNVSPTMNISLSSKQDCNNNAVITTNINGGVPTYQYKWNSNNANANTITVTAPASVVLTVTDNFGCTASSNTLDLKAIVPMKLTTTIKPATTNNDGEIDLTVAGPTGTFTYLWSNGAITEDVKNLAPGTYCVEVIDNNGCKQNDCFVVAKSTVSVKENDLSKSLMVFPNPALDIVTIEVKGNITLQKMQLFDDKGRLLSTFGGEIRQIDMSDYPSAIYFLHCIAKDGSAVKRIVKMD